MGWVSSFNCDMDIRYCIRVGGGRLRTALTRWEYVRCSIYLLLEILDGEIVAFKGKLDCSYTFRVAKTDGSHNVKMVSVER